MSRTPSPETKATLIEGDIRQHLIRLTVPMVWAILAMHSINIADTWFVAQLGKASLAAMSFTFPVVMLLLSLGIGFMAGTSSVLSRVIGQGDDNRVSRLTTDSILLAIVCAVVLSVVGLLTMDSIFLAMGASEELLPLIREYMVIWFAGYLFLLVPMAGIGCLRATGDSKLQSRIMMIAAVLNLILDPILIFGLLGVPAFGIAGAAIATVVARGATMIIGYRELRKRNMISLELPSLPQLFDSWKSLAHV
ncbi:MAG: Na+-driven multidrug efflux pump, partial [Gammaproteobacteria bacterium]